MRSMSISITRRIRDGISDLEDRCSEWVMPRLDGDKVEHNQYMYVKEMLSMLTDVHRAEHRDNESGEKAHVEDKKGDLCED